MDATDIPVTWPFFDEEAQSPCVSNRGHLGTPYASERMKQDVKLHKMVLELVEAQAHSCRGGSASIPWRRASPSISRVNSAFVSSGRREGV